MSAAYNISAASSHIDIEYARRLYWNYLQQVFRIILIRLPSYRICIVLVLQFELFCVAIRNSWA